MEKDILTLSQLKGQYVYCQPLDKVEHLSGLYVALGGKENVDLWTYRLEAPFLDIHHFSAYLDTLAPKKDSAFFTIMAKGKPVGLMGMISNVSEHRRIELGSICLSKELQRTRAATEAYFLIFCYVFEQLKYRRLEWKCDYANKASINAALRLGFTYEGLFRQHLIIKGKNRDTWWSSLVDSDWVNLKKTYIKWLDSRNFNEEGIQVKSLKELVK